MMEKNGNTLAPGDLVAIYPGEKVAWAKREYGTIEVVDVDKGLVKVVHTLGTGVEWVPFDKVVKLP